MELPLLIAVLAALLALATALAKLFADFRALARARPPEPRVDQDALARIATKAADRVVPRLVLESFSDHTRKLHDEVRRASRHELEELLLQPEFNARVERMIEDKLVNGAFSTQVRHIVEEEVHFAENGIAPEADSGVWEADPGKTAESLLASAARRASRQAAEKKLEDTGAQSAAGA